MKACPFYTNDCSSSPWPNAIGASGRPLPCILAQRQEGQPLQQQRILAAWGDRRKRPRPRTGWKLSVEHQIRSTAGGRAATCTMDLTASDSRFLLSGTRTGTVTIFDLWKSERWTNPYVTSHSRSMAYQNNIFSSQRQTQQCYTPIQQASVFTTAVSVQWYPVDSGIFLTAAAAGTVSLWDTERMESVLHSKPFQQHQQQQQHDYNTVGGDTGVLSCMHVSPFSLLAATGSPNSSTVKLVDLQSGASSHSLITSGTKHARSSSSNRHGRSGGGGGGVTNLQWSPIHPNVLAVAANQTASLWDIRKTQTPLTVVDAGYRPSDPSLSTPVGMDGSHYKSFKKQRKELFHTTTTTTTTASSVAFDETGHFLVTACGTSRTLDVWDLRYHWAPVRQLRTFCDANNGKPIDAGMNSSLRVHRKTIWVSKGNQYSGYPLSGKHQDIPKTTVVDAKPGAPVYSLRGHLGRVEASVASSNILTSASDGLILVWEPTVSWSDESSEDDANRTQQNTKKRRTVDVDSW